MIIRREGLCAEHLFPDDLKLVDRLLEKDSGAWDFVVKEYGPFLEAIARQAGLTDEDAKDCVQDSLASLWDDNASRLREYRGIASVKTYLARIVHRDCIDFIRKNNREKCKIRLKTFAYMVEDIDGLEKVVHDRSELEALLDVLEPKDRLLAKLIYYDGLTSREAGRILGANVSTIDVWHFRLKQKLRAAAGVDIPAGLQESNGEEI